MPDIPARIDPIEGLQAVTAAARAYDLPEQGLKPCLAWKLQGRADYTSEREKDGDRFHLVTELLCLGKNAEQIERIVGEWDSQTSGRVAPASDIRGKIRRGEKRQYRFSCQHPTQNRHCVGSADCPNYKHLRGRRRIISGVRDFHRLEWPAILGTVRVALYKALVYLEEKRGLFPGAPIYAGHRELAGESGAALASVGRALHDMDLLGLLAVTPGDPRRWRKKATEVRRILPVGVPPMLPGETVSNLKQRTRRARKQNQNGDGEVSSTQFVRGGCLVRDRLMAVSSKPPVEKWQGRKQDDSAA